eukprot:TRINITY_DN64374_c0_g1_i1.p1 TRINITY_DN64374_c0_g1~~TRINITY_DN64374_c0_g1_i1.p1  ORF type:complete len:506 (-),score=85.50 TRINITY_DN64374_c0_g1_i1:377-1714(-)
MQARMQGFMGQYDMSNGSSGFSGTSNMVPPPSSLLGLAGPPMPPLGLPGLGGLPSLPASHPSFASTMMGAAQGVACPAALQQEDPSKIVESLKADLLKAESATKVAAQEGGAFVGIVSRLSVQAGTGAIECAETTKQYGVAEVQIPRDQLIGLQVGDTVVFRVSGGDQSAPQATFARKVAELTQQRQRILEVEAPLPGPGAAESPQEYVGFVNSFQPPRGFGFLSCANTRQLYGTDVYIHRDQFVELNVGDAVHFRVALSPKGSPVARGVRKAIGVPGSDVGGGGASSATAQRGPLAGTPPPPPPVVRESGTPPPAPPSPPAATTMSLRGNESVAAAPPRSSRHENSSGSGDGGRRTRGRSRSMSASMSVSGSPARKKGGDLSVQCGGTDVAGGNIRGSRSVVSDDDAPRSRSRRCSESRSRSYRRRRTSNSRRRSVSSSRSRRR